MCRRLSFSFPFFTFFILDSPSWLLLSGLSNSNGFKFAVVLFTFSTNIFLVFHRSNENRPRVMFWDFFE